MREFLTLFKAGKETWSMKRFCGLLGWSTIIYCMVNGINPPFMDVFIGSCVVLLGVEAVTNIFKKDNE